MYIFIYFFFFLNIGFLLLLLLLSVFRLHIVCSAKKMKMKKKTHKKYSFLFLYFYFLKHKSFRKYSHFIMEHKYSIHLHTFYNKCFLKCLHILWMLSVVYSICMCSVCVLLCNSPLYEFMMSVCVGILYIGTYISLYIQFKLFLSKHVRNESKKSILTKKKMVITTLLLH